MKLIMQKLNVGLSDSKMIIEHTSSPTGNCGRCGQKLLESGITYCPACNSLNLNW
jgi:Zn finger protein HypA/HybF involved in hydrogenase expression